MGGQEFDLRACVKSISKIKKKKIGDQNIPFFSVSAKSLAETTSELIRRAMAKERPRRRYIFEPILVLCFVSIFLKDVRMRKTIRFWSLFIGWRVCNR